jgi:hypothetical protein
MVWSYLQGASAQTLVNTNASATYGSNVSAGTKLIVLIGCGGSTPTLTSVQDGSGNNFTQGAFIKGSVSLGTIAALYFLDTPAGSVGTKPTVTVIWSSNQDTTVTLLELSGLLPGNTTACLDGTPGTVQATETASFSQPAYSSSVANEFLISYTCDNGGGVTGTRPAGYTDATTGPGSSGSSLDFNTSSATNSMLCYKNSTGGAESGNWGFAGGTLTGAAFIVAAFQIPAVILPPVYPTPSNRVVTVPFFAGVAGAQHSR